MQHKSRFKYIISFIILTFIALVLLGLNLLLDKNTESAVASPKTNSLQAQISELEPVLNRTSYEYYTAQKDFDAAEENVSEAQRKIEYCNEEIPKYEEIICNNLVKEYKDGNLYFLNMLINVDSLKELTCSINYLNIINKEKREHIT